MGDSVREILEFDVLVALSTGADIKRRQAIR